MCNMITEQSDATKSSLKPNTELNWLESYVSCRSPLFAYDDIFVASQSKVKTLWSHCTKEAWRYGVPFLLGQGKCSCDVKREAADTITTWNVNSVRREMKARSFAFRILCIFATSSRANTKYPTLGARGNWLTGALETRDWRLGLTLGQTGGWAEGRARNVTNSNCDDTRVCVGGAKHSS
jgi:hypothetical protein